MRLYSFACSGGASATRLLISVVNTLMATGKTDQKMRLQVSHFPTVAGMHAASSWGKSNGTAQVHPPFSQSVSHYHTPTNGAHGPYTL